MKLINDLEALKEKEKQLQEVREELCAVREKLSKLTIMEQMEKEEREHLMQETLKRALDVEKGRLHLEGQGRSTNRDQGNQGWRCC